MTKLHVFAYSGDPDQMLHFDMCLHCLLITLLGVSRLKWVKYDQTAWMSRSGSSLCEFGSKQYSGVPTKILTQYLFVCTEVLLVETVSSISVPCSKPPSSLYFYTKHSHFQCLKYLL